MLRQQSSPPFTAGDQLVLELDMARWVADTLADCTDPMPDALADDMELSRGARYMDGARLIKLILAEGAEVSPC